MNINQTPELILVSQDQDSQIAVPSYHWRSAI